MIVRRYIEFAVAAVIISVLFVILNGRLDEARKDVEEARMQSQVTALRLALLETAVHRQVSGGALPSSANPMAWVDLAVENYVGERRGVPEEEAVWYFDVEATELVYRFRDRHHARFRLARSAQEGQGRVAFDGISLVRLADSSE